jgi:hypothetical protein
MARATGDLIGILPLAFKANQGDNEGAELKTG